MRAPAVVLCGFCAQRSPGAPAIESIRLEPGLSHGFHRGDFPGTPAGNHPFEVIRQGLWPSTGVLAPFLSNSDSLALALQDVLPLKFRDCHEHGQHKLAGGRGRVDCLLAADEFYLFLGQSFHEIKQVARVSRKSAD